MHTNASCLTLWSKIVRMKGYCEMCGRTDLRLNAHHLIRKDYRFFRHNLENGICLCASCHIFNTPPKISAHGTPIAFDDWLRDTFPDRHEWLKKNRHKDIKFYPDYNKIWSVLKEQENEL